MIDTALLDDLLKRMQAAGLTELEVQQGDTKIAMRLGTTPAVMPGTTTPVHTQSLGIFRASHPRRKASEQKLGQKVPKGTVLGYLEAASTLTAITASTTGTIIAILAADGDLLGYGAHVFTLEDRGQ